MPSPDARLRRLGVEAAGEHTEAVEDEALASLSNEYDQSTVARKRLVALDRAAPPAGEEPEPFVERGAISAGRHRHDPRRGELDRERDAVEPAADLADRCRVATRRARSRAAPLRARSMNRRTASLSIGVDGSRRSDRGSGSDRSGHDPLAVDAEPSRLVASIRTSGHVAQTRSASVAAGVEQVLAVVEHEQQLAWAAGTRRMLSVEGSRTLLHAQGRRDDLRPSLGVDDRCELAEPHAVRGTRQHLGRDLQREARLADATRRR